MIGNVTVKLDREAKGLVESLIDAINANTAVQAGETLGILPPKPAPECCERCDGKCSRAGR